MRRHSCHYGNLRFEISQRFGASDSVGLDLLDGNALIAPLAFPHNAERAFAELLARVDALVRRRDPGTVKTKVAVGDLELDLLSRTAKRNGSAIELQPREFRLLEYLMRHAGQIVTRTMLLENVWEYHFDPQTNVIDVHISRLRAKIDKGFAKPLLHTIRGAGYMVRDPK